MISIRFDSISVGFGWIRLDFGWIWLGFYFIMALIALIALQEVLGGPRKA